MRITQGLTGNQAGIYFGYALYDISTQTEIPIKDLMSGSGTGQGIKGDKGDQGEVGPQGPQGLVGATGATGPAGPIGPQGPQGPIGLTGATGATGPQGVKGDKGDQGEVGPQGPVGEKGEQGSAGMTGATGPQGPIGPAGPQGEQGIQGLTGATGPAGPAGLTWTGEWSSTQQYSLNESVSYGGVVYFAIQESLNQEPSSTSEYWRELSIQGGQGEQGPAGPAGATGPQGPEGPQGEQGVQGLTGPQGPVGPQGEAGPTGPAGPQGEQGVQGLTGETGATGATGPAGPAGAAGSNGQTGEVGPQGPEGPQGPAGMVGPQGEKGDKGDQGETGPQGPAGESRLYAYHTAVASPWSNDGINTRNHPLPNHPSLNITVVGTFTETTAGGGLQVAISNRAESIPDATNVNGSYLYRLTDAEFPDNSRIDGGPFSLVPSNGAVYFTTMNRPLNGRRAILEMDIADRDTMQTWNARIYSSIAATSATELGLYTIEIRLTSDQP